MAKMNDLIKLSHADIYYEENKREAILRQVELTLHEGEIVGLSGESGSGKTTLAYVLCGMKGIASGTLQCPFHKVAMILQNPESSFDSLRSVGWTLCETRKYYLKGKKRLLPKREDLRREIMEKLERFGIAAERFDDFPWTFSGGELQRAAILRALLREPKILILDEVTSMLDVLVQAKIMRFLLSIQKKYQLSYFVISHEPELLHLMADRIYQIKDGRVSEMTGGRNAHS